MEMQWYTVVNSSAQNPVNEYESLADLKIEQNVLKEPRFGANNIHESMKSDGNVMLKKKWLTILGLLLAVIFAVSLAAAVVAVLAYFKPITQTRSESPQTQEIKGGQGVNISALMDLVSSELHRIQNESAPTDDLQSISRKLDDFHANLSLLAEQVSSIQLALMNVATTDDVNNDLMSLGHQLNGLDSNLEK